MKATHHLKLSADGSSNLVPLAMNTPNTGGCTCGRCGPKASGRRATTEELIAMRSDFNAQEGEDHRAARAVAVIDRILDDRAGFGWVRPIIRGEEAGES